MKANHVLINYGNVQPAVAEALAQPIFKVWVFAGAQQSKVKFDLFHLLRRKGDSAKVIKMTSSGRNALDFHMSNYLGNLVKECPGNYYHLVAKDTGMDPLIEHMGSMGVKAARLADGRSGQAAGQRPEVPRRQGQGHAQEVRPDLEMAHRGATD